MDDEIRLQGSSHAGSSHEASLEPITKRRGYLGKHNVHTHFPKDRNCEICKRNKIIRAPCRRRNGEAVPRAEIFSDLITADHKVLSDNCESRNNHRYAVAVQDLATKWIQAYPCKTKSSQETQTSLQEFLEPDRKPEVIYTDNSLEFGKACEDLSWNHYTSTPHRSRTNGIVEKALRRGKEGTSAVLLQSGLNESWWADSMECYTYLRKVTDLLSDGKTPYERRCVQPFKGPIFPFGSLVECHSIPSKDQSKIHQIGKKAMDCSSDTHFSRVEFGRVTYWLQTLRSWKRWTHRKSTRKDSMRKKWYFPNKEKLFFQSQMDESKTLEEIRNCEHPPWYGRDQFKEKVTMIFLENQKGLFHNHKFHFWMPVKRLMISGPCQETSFADITLNPESSFARPDKNHYLFHLNALTFPQLPKRIWMSSKRNASMNFWNIDGSRDLSDYWTSFTRFIFGRKPPNRYMWFGWRLTRKQLTSRPHHFWLEL